MIPPICDSHLFRISIDRIGSDIVSCKDACSGVSVDQTAGILPRCLILERQDAIGIGCLAVGLNPGRSKKAEQLFYLNGRGTYQSLKDYWSAKGAGHPYYLKTRRLIDDLGLTGPILWSELAKCESAAGLKSPPLQTMRHCSARFLTRELQAVPTDWPVIALGREAYVALAYLLPKRTVIGIPHPTGSFGTFHSMYLQNSLRPAVKSEALTALESFEPAAVWLGPRNHQP